MHGPDSGEPLFPGSVRDRCKPTSWCGNGNHLGMVSDVQRRTMQPFVSWCFLWTFTSRITSNITLPQSVRPRQITPRESGSSPDAGLVLGREALLLPIEGKGRYKGMHAWSARSPLFISADRSESVKALKQIMKHASTITCPILSLSSPRGALKISRRPTPSLEAAQHTHPRRYCEQRGVRIDDVLPHPSW